MHMSNGRPIREMHMRIARAHAHEQQLREQLKVGARVHVVRARDVAQLPREQPGEPGHGLRVVLGLWHRGVGRPAPVRPARGRRVSAVPAGSQSRDAPRFACVSKG